jgi:hypothetical protein
MRLSEYITEVGDAEFAARFAVSERTAMAYRLGQRRPRSHLAKQIVESSPVTWAGIYEPEEKLPESA